MIAAVRESNSARTSSLRFYSAPSSDGDPDERLKIEGAGDVVISTGDLIFASTASAAYFVGDGSQLTNLPSSGGGTTEEFVWFMA